MKANHPHITFKCALLLSSLALGCCTYGGKSSKLRLAKDIAIRNQMSLRYINTQNFALTSFERISGSSNAPTSIYIEGDGLAWLSRSTPSRNPTPKNPVGLRLASRDHISKNVIYIARPCQYTEISKTRPCPAQYWTSKRFAPEVIQSFNQAIDQLKQKHKLGKLELIGYSGGAAVATLLAAQRDDVINLRTVAGNIDIDAFSKFHNVSKMPLSLNPAKEAYKLKDLPQMHFIGEEDSIVPAAIFNSYKRKAGAPQCVNSQIVYGVSHEKGWEAVWPQLITHTPSCN